MSVIQDPKSLKITIGKDKRITKVGYFIRKYKIDELPQLINVVKSQMSIVGPRPEVPEYVKLYSAYDYEVVLSVKPGITDLASIEFRNESLILANSTDPEKTYIDTILHKKLKYYLFYVKHQSFTYDFVIILKTLKAIIYGS
jgi:lipopolysaccharide/colanic/teichoic acid biosynthesis glycosyltransferase